MLLKIKTHIRSFLIFLIAIFWPLHLIGFTGPGGFPINLSFIFYLIFVFYLITHNNPKKNNFILILIFVVYQILVRLISTNNFNSVLSPLIFTLLIFPFLYNPVTSKDSNDNSNKKIIINGIKLGLYISLFILVIEVALLLITSHKLQEYLPFSFAKSFNYSNYIGFKKLRFHSAFDEPAHYAIYLVFCYIIFDISWYKQNFNFPILLRGVILFALLITQSLSGYVLIFIYFIFLHPLLKTQNKNIFINLIKKLLIGITLLVLVFAIFRIIKPEDFEYNKVRLQRSVELIKNREYTREGARINAIFLIHDLSKTSNFFFGIGDVTDSNIISKNYSHENNKIANSIVAITFRIGFIGLILYLLAFLPIFYKAGIPIFISFLLLHFILGNWVSVLFWIPLLLCYELFYQKA